MIGKYIGTSELNLDRNRIWIDSNFYEAFTSRNMPLSDLTLHGVFSKPEDYRFVRILDAKYRSAHKTRGKYLDFKFSGARTLHLPLEAREFLDVDGKIVLFGNFDVFEVWNPEDFAKWDEKAKGDGEYSRAAKVFSDSQGVDRVLRGLLAR